MQDFLSRFFEKTGRVDGLLTAFPESLQTDAILDLMVSEAIKTSEIEGELLSRPDVMSAAKYMAIAKTSKPTATRDLKNFVVKEMSVPVGGGRSVRYQIAF